MAATPGLQNTCGVAWLPGQKGVLDSKPKRMVAFLGCGMESNGDHLNVPAGCLPLPFGKPCTSKTDSQVACPNKPQKTKVKLSSYH